MKAILIVFLSFLICLVPILLSVALLTLIERKILGAMQRRKGPNMVGWLGILQPFADALKLILKEVLLPSSADKLVFISSSFVSLFLSLFIWVVIPFGHGMVLADLNLGILFIFAISSLNVYAIIMAGWSSNSRYAFLGALRSAAQMISYEVSIGLLLMPIFLIAGSLNLTQIVLQQQHVWFVIPFFPNFIFFFISALAETNRPPFDLPEAEAELVAGYNVEYSSISFAFFFIAEYSNIILMSSISVLLFFGGWLFPFFIYLNAPVSNAFVFSLKTVFIMFLFVWVRASLPRYRYDQLMNLGWKIFLPFSLGWFLFVISIVATFVL